MPVTGGFSIDALLMSSPSDSFTMDAEISYRHFTMDAWIISERWRHHRTRDHFGPESDIYVVLSEDVEGYTASTPIHFVIADLVSRLSRLESYNRHRASFRVDAYLYAPEFGAFTADSVVQGSAESSFTLDSYLTNQPFGHLTLDAFIGAPDEVYAQFSFTIDAFIV